MQRNVFTVFCLNSSLQLATVALNGTEGTTVNMNWYLQVLRHSYADFTGRARRSEFWYFQLLNHLIIGFLAVLLLIFVIVPGMVSLPAFISSMAEGVPMKSDDMPAALPLLTGALIGLGIIVVLYLLYILIPSTAVTIRRLHDTGRNGWLVLLSLIPIANLLLLAFLCEDSQPADNYYGLNPKTLPVT